MKNNKFFLTLAALLASVTMMAATSNLNPVADYNFRTNGTVTDNVVADPTGWNGSYPKTNAETIECTYSAQMWGQQLYDVTDVDMVNASAITLTLYNSAGNTYRLGAWLYPDADWTEDAQRTWTDGTCPVVENFKTVVGAYPGQVTPQTYLAYASESNTDILKQQQVLTFTGTALSTLKKGVVEKDGKKYLSFIITFRETNASYSTGRNPKYYSGNTTTEGKKPVLAIETIETGAVQNETTGAFYETLPAAVAEAEENDVLVLNENVEISARLNTPVAMTIKGATSDIVISRATGLDAITILPAKALTLENLIMDGQSVDRNKPAIEASNGLVDLRNVTIRNFKRTAGNQGILCLKSNGSAILTDVTFENNEVMANYGDVFNGWGRQLTLAGNNVIPNGIYLEKQQAIKAPEATHTEPIKLIIDKDQRTLADGALLVEGGTDASIYTLVNADETWKLKVDEGNVVIYKPTDPTAIDNTNAAVKAVKTIRNGQLVILRDGIEFNALGSKL